MNDKKGRSKYQLLAEYLNIDAFEHESIIHGISKELIYINIIPLMLQAGSKLLDICREYIPRELDSCEAETFINLFEDRDECVPKCIFPYNKETYKSDINNINKLTERIYGKNAPYFKDIRYNAS